MNANRLRIVAVLLAVGLVLFASPAAGKPKADDKAKPAEKPAAAAKKVAVMGLNNRARITDDEVEYLTDLVRGAASRALAGRGFLVLTRENIYELLPPGKQMTDCTSASCEVETGRMIGADYIVTGEVLKFAGELRIIIKAHHSFSGAFLGEQTARGKTLRDLEDTVKKEADALAAQIRAHDDGTFGMPVAQAGPSPSAPEKAAPAKAKDKKEKRGKDKGGSAAAPEAEAPAAPEGPVDKKEVHAMTNAQLGAVVASNPDARTRAAAVRELTARRDPAAVPVLRKAAEQDASADVRGEALAALDRSNGIADAPQTVLRAMGDADPEVRLRACRIAGKRRLPGAGARLCQLLDDPDKKVRAAALGEIGEVKSADAVDCVAARFQKAADSETQLRMVRILRGQGGKRAAAALAGAVAGADGRVQREILVALREMRERSVVPQLEQLRQSTADRRLKKMLDETISYLKKRGR